MLVWCGSCSHTIYTYIVRAVGKCFLELEKFVRRARSSAGCWRLDGRRLKIWTPQRCIVNPRYYMFESEMRYIHTWIYVLHRKCGAMDEVASTRMMGKELLQHSQSYGAQCVSGKERTNAI